MSLSWAPWWATYRGHSPATQLCRRLLGWCVPQIIFSLALWRIVTIAVCLGIDALMKAGIWYMARLRLPASDLNFRPKPICQVNCHLFFLWCGDQKYSEIKKFNGFVTIVLLFDNISITAIKEAIGFIQPSFAFIKEIKRPICADCGYSCFLRFGLIVKIWPAEHNHIRCLMESN